MGKSRDMVKSTMKILLALASTSSMLVASEAFGAEDNEKCYGIVKKGMNDCSTSHQSCAGSATIDSQPDAFVFLPKGVCTKLVGASLTPVNTSSNSKK